MCSESPGWLLSRCGWRAGASDATGQWGGSAVSTSTSGRGRFPTQPTPVRYIDTHPICARLFSDVCETASCRTCWRCMGACGHWFRPSRQRREYPHTYLSIYLFHVAACRFPISRLGSARLGASRLVSGICMYIPCTVEIEFPCQLDSLKPQLSTIVEEVACCAPRILKVILWGGGGV